MELKTVKLDLIDPHPSNPREDLGDLSELAESIKTLGILQAPGVMSNGGTRYIAEFGHRRIAAARLAGLTEIDVAVREETPADVYMALIAENELQKPLTATERARGQQGLLALGDLDRAAKATGVPADLLRAAQKGRRLIGDSEKAKQASLDELKTLNDFEGDPERIAELEKFIGTPSFQWKSEAMVRERRAAEKLAADIKDAEALGATEAERDYNAHIMLDDVRDAEGNEIEPSTVPEGELHWFNYYGRLMLFISQECMAAQGWSRHGGRVETPEEIAEREEREAKRRALDEARETAQACRYAFLRKHVLLMPASLTALVSEYIKKADSWDEFSLSCEDAMALLGVDETPKAALLVPAAILAELDNRALLGGNEPDDTDEAREIIAYLDALKALSFVASPFEEGLLGACAARFAEEEVDAADGANEDPTSSEDAS